MIKRFQRIEINCTKKLFILLIKIKEKVELNKQSKTSSSLKELQIN